MLATLQRMNSVTASKLVVPIALIGLVYIVSNNSQETDELEEPVQKEWQEQTLEDGSRVITTKTGVQFRVPYFQKNIMVYYGVTEDSNLQSFEKLIDETAAEYAKNSMYTPSLAEFTDSAVEYYWHSLKSFKNFINKSSRNLEDIRVNVKLKQEMTSDDIIMKLHMFQSQFLENWGDPQKKSAMPLLLDHLDKEILKRNELLNTNQALFKVSEDDETVLTRQQVENQREQLLEAKTYLEVQIRNAMENIQIVNDIKREWNWTYPSITRKKTDYSSFPFGSIRTGMWIAATKLKNTFNAIGSAGEAISKLACRPQTAPSASVDPPRLNSFTQASSVTIPNVKPPKTPPAAELVQLRTKRQQQQEPEDIPNFSALVQPKKLDLYADTGDDEPPNDAVIYTTLGAPPEITDKAINDFILQTNTIMQKFSKLMKRDPNGLQNEKIELLDELERLSPSGYGEQAISTAIDFQQNAVTGFGSNIDYKQLKKDQVFENYATKLSKARDYITKI